MNITRIPLSTAAHINTARNVRFSSGQPIQPLLKREYVSPKALEIGDHIMLTWPHSNQTEPLEYAVLWTDDKGGRPSTFVPPKGWEDTYMIGVQYADGKSTRPEVFYVRQPVQDEDILRIVKH